MKKLFALLLVFALALTLAACSSDPLYSSSSTDAATADEAETTASDTVNIDDYDDTFDGMQEYLIACGLLEDPDEKGNENVKTETFAEILGAENGVRYTLSSSAFIEFYEYTEENDISKAVFKQVETEGTFSIAGLDELTGVLSSSKKFMAVYNASISYKYEEIIEEFEKF